MDRGPGWMAETEREITPAGRTKVPSRRSCVERILSAWESLLNDVIKWNLETCAVSLPIDGSEDEKIHCFKADGPLSDGTEQVFTERAAAVFNALEEATCVNDNYPFGDLEPGIHEENLGLVHTNPFSNENGVVLLRIRLSSTLQRRKRSPKTEPFENALQSGAI